MGVTHTPKGYRCDEPMRRSKEKCYTPFHTDWHCTGDCMNCICCIWTDENGQDSHIIYSMGNNAKNTRRGLHDR